MQTKDELKTTLEQFRQAYVARDVHHLDQVMDLFASDENIEMIGIGAYERNGNEWFVGHQRIREIIESDREYWGDVMMDTDHANVTIHDQTAWVSMTATLLRDTLHLIMHCPNIWNKWKKYSKMKRLNQSRQWSTLPFLELEGCEIV